MAIKKAYTVTDLGGGDGGKGGVIHKLCALRRPHTVIKVGGAQGSHGVFTSRGERFNFSQFGCGTFNGSRTFISNRFIVSPVGLLNEAHALRYELGVHDPMSFLTVDGNALCTTPYHGIASRLKELARKENPRGIVGVGVGEAYIDAKQFPELAFRAADLGRKDMKSRLAQVRAHKLEEVAEVFASGFMAGDLEEAKEQLDLIRNDDFLDWATEQFEEFAKRVKVVDENYIRREIFSRDGIIVLESSHGILTDRYYGFSPHTSRFRTLPEITSWSLLRDYDYGGDIVKFGVTRAYQIRHGAGPLVTEDTEMANDLLPHEVGAVDRYRGKVRVGPLDTVALRYALNVCGGSNAFDAIAVTWFDSVTRKGEWRVCDRYYGATDPLFFNQSGNIIVRRGDDDAQLRHQESLTKVLKVCCPSVTTFQVSNGNSQEKAIKLCSDVLAERLGTPVRMMSFGPTEADKVCF